nr:PREDICTED: calcium-binding protein P-like isoform X2 [Lepisosteus oculatus]
MRSAIVLMCLIGTTLSMPLQVYQQLQRQMLQQIHHQQQPQKQQAGNPRYFSLSQETMREMARYKAFMQQQSMMFPSLNMPPHSTGLQPPQIPQFTGVQLPHNTGLQPPIQAQPSQTPTSQAPSQLPPQGPSQLPHQMTPSFQPVEYQPGLQQMQLVHAEQQYEYETPFLLPQVPGQLTPVGATAGSAPATPTAPAAPRQQGDQAGQQHPTAQAPQPGVQVLQPNIQIPQTGINGPQPGTQGHQPTLPAQLPPVFNTFGILPIMPPQAQDEQQFPGYGVFFNTAFPQQPVQPPQAAQPGAPPQQQMIPQILYLQIQPMQSAMGGGGFGSASSEEMQAAGGVAGFGGFVPGFAGSGYGGFGGTVPGTEGVFPTGQGILPVAPDAGLFPVGQGGSPTAPAVFPAGHGNLPPTPGSTVPVQGSNNQPAPQSRDPAFSMTTPAGVRAATVGNPPAAAAGTAQPNAAAAAATAAAERVHVNHAERNIPADDEMPEADDYRAPFIYP